MKVFITKANSDYWYEIKDFDTIEDIYNYIDYCKHSLILEKNPYTKNRCFKYWEGMKKEDIPIITKIKLHVTIYNDYVE